MVPPVLFICGLSLALNIQVTSTAAHFDHQPPSRAIVKVRQPSVGPNRRLQHLLKHSALVEHHEGGGHVMLLDKQEIIRQRRLAASGGFGVLGERERRASDASGEHVDASRVAYLEGVGLEVLSYPGRWKHDNLCTAIRAHLDVEVCERDVQLKAVRPLSHNRHPRGTRSLSRIGREVELVEPHGPPQAEATAVHPHAGGARPDDPGYARQWALNNAEHPMMDVDGPEAWDILSHYDGHPHHMGQTEAVVMADDTNLRGDDATMPPKDEAERQAIGEGGGGERTGESVMAASAAGAYSHARVDESEAAQEQQRPSVPTRHRQVPVVAVIDSGVDYHHPDLQGSLWVNQPELNGQEGVDDDGNGYIDDVYGYDFRNNDGDPYDSDGHGTHVMGIIGAIPNNARGIAGVVGNERVKVMSLKFMGADENDPSATTGWTSDAIRALDYSIVMGADITCNSWGGGPYDRGLEEAIRSSAWAKQLFVVAAGNEMIDLDTTKQYPAAFAEEIRNILNVASVDKSGGLLWDSNFGKQTVHLGAPGEQILSTITWGKYAYYSGTSMSAPFVCGVAALALSAYPQLSGDIEAFRNVLLSTLTPLPALQNRTIYGGMVNARAAVQEALRSAIHYSTPPPAADSSGGRVDEQSPALDCLMHDGESNTSTRSWPPDCGGDQRGDNSTAVATAYGHQAHEAAEPPPHRRLETPYDLKPTERADNHHHHHHHQQQQQQHENESESSYLVSGRVVALVMLLPFLGMALLAITVLSRKRTSDEALPSP
ncbi:unnamed protein product [Vitrella brassicaformis CCMP3155]|uniref:subtilisin n=1 Tax=Vitrella brassicaformis (strain CCMP3155) TaxID=1169540 RepID=A0A0G4FUM8_VITBC|nr:unnamed protein product [Vitrella brassicaformis CCMP3155]|eukprot:CEM18653.1 unnamed protein product [Vitrella brassicaformis CCMP3155]